jgi:DNA-binding Lrp family transcriptional regulator
MDDIDRKLVLLLVMNPRVHFRELAAKLGISRQAVHHRVQTLTETGVIKGMHAGISIPYLDAVPVAIIGMTRISDLGSYVDFVKRAANMSEPTVGIYCLDDGLVPGYSIDGSGAWKESFRELSSLDFKIIASLKDNARRPISDIAKVVGVTPKTVRRHLEAMISEGSLALTAPMDSQAGGDLFLITHVILKDGADKIEVGRRLLARQYFQDQYIRTFSNIPDVLIWVFWSDKIKEIRKILEEVGEEEDVLAVTLNFAYSERIYETWRDRLPAALARSSERAGPRRHDSELSKRRSTIAVREYGRR